jgi:hypothetical protein
MLFIVSYNLYFSHLTSSQLSDSTAAYGSTSRTDWARVVKHRAGKVGAVSGEQPWQHSA